MGIMIMTKKVDTKNRIVVPSCWAKAGDLVCYEITKKGNLLVRLVKQKVDKDENEEETILNDNEDSMSNP